MKSPNADSLERSSGVTDAINLGLTLDPEARSETLARLIAASIHDGPGTALEAFASTGTLDPQAALDELNHVRVPIEHEGWIDALGRFILLNSRSRQ